MTDLWTESATMALLSIHATSHHSRNIERQSMIWASQFPMPVLYCCRFNSDGTIRIRRNADPMDHPEEDTGMLIDELGLRVAD